MDSVKLDVPVIAPIPVGNHVTIYALEERKEGFFGTGEWEPTAMKIVCDDDTRIVYTGRFVPADSLRYGAIRLVEGGFRIAGEPLRGRVVACALLTDHGDMILMQTRLEIELDAGAYR